MHLRCLAHLARCGLCTSVRTAADAPRPCAVRVSCLFSLAAESSSCKRRGECSSGGGWGSSLTVRAAHGSKKRQLEEELDKLRKEGDVEWSDCTEKVRPLICVRLLYRALPVPPLSHACGSFTMHTILSRARVSGACALCLQTFTCLRLRLQS